MLAIAFTGCTDSTQTEPSPALPQEQWRLVIQLSQEQLPFDFSIIRNASGEIQRSMVHNGPESIELKSTSIQGDSLLFEFPVFASSIRAHISGDSLYGTWYNNARTNKNRLPIVGAKGNFERFGNQAKAKPSDFSGNWEITFVYQEKDSSKALATFTQDQTQLSGTIRTATGDYRFLEGIAYGNNMRLSTFDGAHAFLFHANLDTENKLTGTFWSGDHWIETWTAERNDTFSLPNPDSLTYMNSKDETFEFSFLNPDNELISLSDSAYQNKGVLIQVLGSWCPNCKDETEWLIEISRKYPADELGIIALDFELSTDTSKAFTNIERMVEYYQMPYQTLFAGRAGKKTASAALPQLNHIMSYPTTIFLNKDHQVKRIYTGFNGPATGIVFEKLTASFEETIRAIISGD